MNFPLPLTTPPKLLSTDLENSTIQKQRKELQLLIAELKDREKELNDMVSVHQRQLLAWEDDRQKVLTLEQKCSRLENELQKRNEIIRSLTQRIKLMETQQHDRRTTLENTQQQLQELSFKASEATSQCQELEERNKSLNESVLELSGHIGRLQAREQELATLLKLKDKDIIETTNHITEFTSRFKELEAGLRETRLGEASAIKEIQDLKQRLKGLKSEVDKLRDDLIQKTAENNEQREELIRLKQESAYWQAELAFATERERRKDQLLLLAKSKQGRTDTELQNLRQIYMKQHHDLQFLHLTLECSQDTQKHEQNEDDTSDGPLDLKSLSLETPGKDGLLGSSPSHLSFLSELKGPLMHSTLRDSTGSKIQKSPSPTSKLQQLLAESRQMVADLEFSTLLPGSYTSSNICGDQNRQRGEPSQETNLQELNSRKPNTSRLS
ncbi:coiled-coil domain-containing protein 62 [Spea bombifrons]|uniref:coiled-coil domain-containing protein 62 n=1 Tax=Spea bombifrons TaxID=233779 RepID=UPI002349D4D7|nr:coiled-coil domain-containing protein 62 [Spea bombifrons]XP_053328241.1 coiled-coil domain-containing protein 62 [Spea bombifrons]